MSDAPLPAPVQEPISFDRMGLVINGAVTYEMWEAALLKAVSMRSALSWAIGDLIVYGQGAYGETYAQAESMTGLDYNTLKNMAYCARTIPQPERKIELTWRHHYLTASMEPGERQNWLNHAIENRLNTEEFRLAIKESRAAALRAANSTAAEASLEAGPGEVVRPLAQAQPEETAVEQRLSLGRYLDFPADLAEYLPEIALEWLDFHPDARIYLID